MNKKITILVATHKDEIYVPEVDFLKPIQVGAANSNRFYNMLHDDEGVNISEKNRAYGEMTAIYWAWKNLDSDYYGLFHYRRYMSFSDKSFPITNQSFIFGEVLDTNLCDKKTQDKYCINESSMRSTIEANDFIATEPVASSDGASVYNQYKYAFGHHIEDLDKVISIIKSKHGYLYDYALEYFRGHDTYTCNMFIMKKNIFYKYCDFIFSVLQEFESSRSISKYADVDNRVIGYLAERLTGIFLNYLYASGFKGKNLQRVYFDNTETKPIAPINHEEKKVKEKPSLYKMAKSLANTEQSLKKSLKKIYRKVKPAVVSNQKYYHPKYKNLNEFAVYFNMFDCHVLPNGFVSVNLEILNFRKGDSLTNKISVLKNRCSDFIVGDIKTLTHNVSKVSENSSYQCEKMNVFFTITNVFNLDVCVSIDDDEYAVQIDSQLIKNKLSDRAIITQNSSQRIDYNEWVEANKLTEVEFQKQRLTAFSVNPKFSIVVPLYNTDSKFFREMADSVLCQTYTNFELILVNASPDNAGLKSLIKEYQDKSSKIQCITLEKNLGITENTNFGIDAAKGDFICFLDHDDTIEPNALFEYVKELNEDPEIDLFYCDEDKLLNKKYLDPYFKPDFNWDLLFGINYVCHFLCCRTSIVKSIDRPTSVYDGAQDHNMTLRVAEKARNICHVPKVLYHWRIHENSTASDPEEKGYTLKAARLSVQHYFDRNKIPAMIVNSLKIPRHYEVQYDMPQQLPLVSIVIPSKNHVEILKNCIDSIYERTSYENFEIVVVDNNSDSEDIEQYYVSARKHHDNLKVIKDNGDFNFSRIVNNGVKASNGEYVVLLNNDTEVITDNWLEKMVGPAMYRNDVGIVGAKLLFKDDTVQHAGIIIASIGPVSANYRLGRYDAGYYDTAVLPMDVSCVTGACMLIKRSIYDELSGFDEGFPTNYNDVDFCLKAREAGYLVYLQSTVELYHYESLTREVEENSKDGKTKMKAAFAKLVSRYPNIFANGDPYYNPNFGAGNYYRFE